jgi:hypothetical protein
MVTRNHINSNFYEIANVDSNGNVLDITVGNINTANLTANGLVTLNDVSNLKVTGGNIGQVLATDGTGNLLFIDQSGGGGGGGSSIANGSSSISIPVFNGDIIGSVNGSTVFNISNAVTDLNTDLNTNNITANGNLFVNNITSNGNVSISETITANSITSNSNVSASGNISGNNITLTNDITGSNLIINTISSSGTSISIQDNVSLNGNLNLNNKDLSGISSGSMNTLGTNNLLTGNLSTGNITSTGSGINFNARFLSNIGEPVNANSAATKNYVDLFVQGISVKTSVRVATNTDLATISGGTVTYNNGTSGVGATLTTTGTFAQIDSITIVNSDRILIKNETNSAHNGIYTKTSDTVLTRATDSDTPTKLKAGVFVFIEAGTLYQDTGWVQTETITTIGTDPVTFSQFTGAGTYTAGPGLDLVGTQFSLASDISVTGNVQVGNLLTVTGNTEMTGDANVWGNLLANTNLNVNGITDLNDVSNVKIEGGTSNQFLQTDGTGNLTFANALQNFTLIGNTNISNNGISISTSNVNTSGQTVTITNTGVISYDKITWADNDIGGEVFNWDSQQGPIVFKTVNSATFVDTSLGYTVVPAVNSSQGTVWTRRDYNWQNPNSDILIEADILIDGTADSCNFWWATNNAAGSTVNREGTFAAGTLTAAASVGIDFFNFDIYVKGTLTNLSPSTGIRTGTNFQKFQILHRYIDSQNTMIYVFFKDMLLAYRNIGAFTPTGNYFGVSANTGGANAIVRMRRFTIRSGNDFKYQHLPNLPVVLTYSYTGSDQTWTAPNYITGAYVSVQGASGSNSAASGGTGGRGANIHGFLPITGGSTYTIAVGGTPNNNSRTPAAYGNGGWGGNNSANGTAFGTAGGGFSGFFEGTPSLANAIIVAGGGGGARGGGATGTSGGNATVGLFATEYDGFDGAARSGSFPNTVGRGSPIVGQNGAASGGAAGVPVDTNSVLPQAGSAFTGGNGGSTTNSTHVGGGGGGAGYYGGGGAAAGGTATGGGGGGSSFFKNTGNTFYPINVTGGAYGNGIVTITYNGRP